MTSSPVELLAPSIAIAAQAADARAQLLADVLDRVIARRVTLGRGDGIDVGAHRRLDGAVGGGRQRHHVRGGLEAAGGTRHRGVLGQEGGTGIALGLVDQILDGAAGIVLVELIGEFVAAAAEIADLAHVGIQEVAHQLLLVRTRDAVGLGRQDDGGGDAPDVPDERPPIALVAIVDVEHAGARRIGEGAEIVHMHVAVQPSLGGLGGVVGRRRPGDHVLVEQMRGAAIEREGVHRHLLHLGRQIGGQLRRQGVVEAVKLLHHPAIARTGGVSGRPGRQPQGQSSGPHNY